MSQRGLECKLEKEKEALLVLRIKKGAVAMPNAGRLVSGISLLALKIRCFFSIRSHSSVSYTYYKPSSICQKTVLQGFPSQRFRQPLIILQSVLSFSESKISLEVCDTAQRVAVSICSAKQWIKRSPESLPRWPENH